jgi:hypothetical protein
MTVPSWLQVLAAVATVATGLFALIRPLAVQGFTGLRVDGPRGVSEVRSIFGGLFIGLGAAPLILNNVAAYQMLGIGYLAIAAARSFSIALDRSRDRSNIISLVVEIVFGLILVF